MSTKMCCQTVKIKYIHCTSLEQISQGFQNHFSFAKTKTKKIIKELTEKENTPKIIKHVLIFSLVNNHNNSLLLSNQVTVNNAVLCECQVQYFAYNSSHTKHFSLSLFFCFVHQFGSVWYYKNITEKQTPSFSIDSHHLDKALTPSLPQHVKFPG